MRSLIEDLAYAVRKLLKDPSFTLVALATLTLGIGANSAIFTVVDAVVLRPLPFASPALGRTLLPSDSQPGANRAVVLGSGLWRRRFGADPAVLGRTLILNGAPFTVVGVLRGDAGFPSADVELWAPASVIREDEIPHLRQLRWMKAIARLKPGVTLDRARAELAASAYALAQQYPASNKGWTEARVVPLQSWMIGDTRKPLLILLAVVGMVLLIACANLANLLLAKASGRGREIAIRTALGAARSRVVRQLLTESTLLSLLGGILGLFVATWTVKALVGLSTGLLPRVQEIAVDPRVMIFTLLLSLFTGALFGLAPALELSRLQPGDSLKQKTATGGRGRHRHRLQGLLVVAETALAVSLASGSGLVGKSLWNLVRVEPGFHPANVLVASFSIPESRYPESSQPTFLREIEQRLTRQAGFLAVGWIQRLPLSGRGGERDILTAVGEPAPAPGQEPTAIFNPISGDYFRAMGIPLIEGRAFSTHDDATAPPVVVVTRTVARRLFGERDPLGQAVRSGDAPPMRIVGVVGDVKSRGLAAASELEVYVPFAQRMRLRVALVARTRANPLRFAGVLRSTIQDVDKLLPVSSVQTMEDVMADSTARPRFLALLMGIFSGLALVLAAVGIYGVISCISSQRAQEIGVRMALGATRADILRLIVGHGLGMAVAGVALGLLVTSGGSRLMGSLLFEVSPTDGATYGAVAAVLVLVAAGASYLPARRAAAADPVRALGQE